MKKLLVGLLLMFLVVGCGSRREGEVISSERGTTVLKENFTIRDAAVLTGSYVFTNEIDLSKYNEVELVFDLTPGSLTSVEVIIWHGFYIDTDQDDKGDTWVWAGEVTESVSTTTITWSPNNYTIDATATSGAFATDTVWFVPMPHHGQHLKIQVKGTGTATGSSLAIYGTGSKT